MNDRQELVRRAEEYCRRSSNRRGRSLGYGVHGIVFEVEGINETRQSAIKVHEREKFYMRERDVYRRLQEEGVSLLQGCTVPRMLRSDDELWVIEMTLVSPPYVLDFAGAYLDDFPDYSDEVLAENEAERQQQFGENWRKARLVILALEQHGIYLVDANPNNIRTSAE